LTATGTIEVENVWKTFRIFRNRNTTLKQALVRRNKDEYEEFWALRDVSFTITPGSTFGFVGANGAGKSTMLKVLARILVPDKGRMSVNGRVSALLELGAGFHPELTGRENIFLNGSILGMSQATLRGKYDQIVEFSGLEEFIDQPVKTYSSGMFSRLGFAVAVAV
jgi:ABC-type polysaccharide/polyol phosphate transport system ATPase subunit